MKIETTIEKLNALRKNSTDIKVIFHAEKFVRVLKEIPNFNLENEDIATIENELSTMFIKDEIDHKTIRIKLSYFLDFLNRNFSIVKPKQNIIYLALIGSIIGLFWGFLFLIIGLFIGSLIGYLLDLDALNNNRTLKTNFDIYK